MAYGAFPTAVLAQDVGSQLDFNLQRLEQIAGPSLEEELEREGSAEIVALDGRAPPKWTHIRTFAIGAPFTLSTNPTRVSDDAESRAHLTPFVRFIWVAKSERFTVSAMAATQHDEFVDFAPTDQTAFVGQLKVQLNRPPDEFAPYVSYTPQIAYRDFFTDRIATVHDLAAGMVRRFEAAKGKPRRGAIDVDLAYVRRESDVAEAEQHRPTLKVKFTDPLGKNTEWSIEQTVQPRFSTGGANDGRFDLNLKTLLAFNWILPKLKPLRLGATVTAEWNESGRTGGDYTLFDLGPSLSAVWTW